MSCHPKFSSILILILLAFTTCHQLLLAKPTATPDKIVLKETIVASFTVKNNKYVIELGTKQDYLQAKQFIMDALQQQQATLSGVNYQVCVKRLLTNFKSNTDSLTVDQYDVEIKTPVKNKTLRQFLMNLQSQRYLVSDMPYEAPVTCNYFMSGNKLVLLSYYGFAPAYQGFNP